LCRDITFEKETAVHIDGVRMQSQLKLRG